jgi:hypothetical protein
MVDPQNLHIEDYIFLHVLAFDMVGFRILVAANLPGFAIAYRLIPVFVFV